jgi:hypothetical protein
MELGYGDGIESKSLSAGIHISSRLAESWDKIST